MIASTSKEQGHELFYGLTYLFQGRIESCELRVNDSAELLKLLANFTASQTSIILSVVRTR